MILCNLSLSNYGQETKERQEQNCNNRKLIANGFLKYIVFKEYLKARGF